jgi:glycosyltransferase involved in cell wall biosynthesis
MLLNNNVLYISYDGMTDQLGQSQVIPYLQGLAKHGYIFSLISCEKKEKYKNDKEKIEKLLKASGIDWYPLIYHKSPPVLSTVYDTLLIWNTAKKLHKQKKFGLVHCRSYISALIGLMMKKKYNVKFLFDMRGLWADERVDGDLWNLKKPLYKWIYNFFKHKEKQFLENADYTVSLTHRAKEEIHTWKHINNQPIPIEVIPCCVDMDLFDPDKISAEEKNKFASELGIQKEDFILTYLGSIGTWYMLSEMLQFFKQLLCKIPKAKFLFINGDEHEQIRTTALKIDIPTDRIILRKASRREVPILLSLSTYSIFFIKPVYSKIASSPTKLGEIMAMGIPVLTNDGVGDTDDIIRNHNAGLMINDFNQNSYDAIINELLNYPMFKRTLLIKVAKEYFSLTIGIEKYYNLYKKL